MYDSQEIARRIKMRVKQRGTTCKEMLSDCHLGINTISYINRGGDIASLSLAKIADYLDCSVDYLLGRTDNPEINQ